MVVIVMRTELVIVCGRLDGVIMFVFFFFFFKQKTAYEIYQCDWSSDVCSSDLANIPTIICQR